MGNVFPGATKASKLRAWDLAAKETEKGLEIVAGFHPGDAVVFLNDVPLAKKRYFLTESGDRFFIDQPRNWQLYYLNSANVFEPLP